MEPHPDPRSLLRRNGQAGNAGNPRIGVELLGTRGRDTIFTGAGLSVDGAAVGQAAVLVHREGPARFAVLSGPGCGGPWTPWSPARTTRHDLRRGAQPALALCEPGGTRTYRGDMQVVEGAATRRRSTSSPSRTTCAAWSPARSSASWGDSGRRTRAERAEGPGRRGPQLRTLGHLELLRQDVRHDLVPGLRGRAGAPGTTTSLEHPLTDRAVAETTGQVRRWPNGRFARTEFSSSTGGWTAGGEFPAVEDLGDATASNPHRNWSVYITASTLGRPARHRTRHRDARHPAQRPRRRRRPGPAVTVDTTTGPVDLSGDPYARGSGSEEQLVHRVDLQSRTRSGPTSSGSTRVLGRRPGGTAEMDPWTAAVPPDRRGAIGGAGRSPSPGERVARSWSRPTPVRPARSYGGSGGRDAWGSLLGARRHGDGPACGIYGSAEALATRGGGDLRVWVDAAYGGLLGRSAAGRGATHWADRVRAGGTGGVAREISAVGGGRSRRGVGALPADAGAGRRPGRAGALLAGHARPRRLHRPRPMASSDEFWIRLRDESTALARTGDMDYARRIGLPTNSTEPLVPTRRRPCDAVHPPARAPLRSYS